MVLLCIVSAICSTKTSNGKPRNKQLITFLRGVIKSHTPSSLQLTVNYCLSIICVCCLPSGHVAAASGIESTNLLLKCLCSSKVYFYLIMALKYKVMLTKKRCKVFPFIEKYSKQCWERGHIHITCNTVGHSNEFIIVILSLCLIHK